ncbi:hypothetical protein K488DRAFT_50974 [Vararia minispora EC-137]|uniref:Uncharacterized protein n=1 Tax=Vararia minispora EC-137 TaxID=1314806 RepID=A0ACB8QJW1_9AGAM|nr:hypothetical protein K488DRAFT_50974 [Vararia minispora EC-137]
MATSKLLPPLKGDATGHYRIHIVGNSGTGKTTLGAQLSAILNVPHVPLDTIAWLPDWRMRDRPAFQQALLDALGDAPTGWVVDGNYTRLDSGLLDGMATDLIWLDPPLLLYFPRLLWRTFLRLIRVSPPCSPGCEERASETFSRDSIVLFCLQHHGVCRTRYGAQLALDIRMRRLGGWGREQRTWVEAVREMAKGE